MLTAMIMSLALQVPATPPEPPDMRGVGGQMEAANLLAGRCAAEIRMGDYAAGDCGKYISADLRARKRIVAYLRYVETLNAWAAARGLTADQAELAMYEAYPPVKRQLTSVLMAMHEFEANFERLQPALAEDFPG